MGALAWVLQRLGESSIATVTLVLALVIILVIYRCSSHDRKCTAPGPWSLPLLGNLLQLGAKPHVTLTSLSRRYGPIFQIRLGSHPCLVLNSLACIKQALVRQSEDFAGRPDFYSFRFIANGNSMGFGDYGPRWKMHRRIAQNALAQLVNRRGHSLEELVAGEAMTLVGEMLAWGDRAEDPHNEIYLSVGAVICAICFGRHYDRRHPDFLHLVRMNDEFMAFAGAGNPVDIMPWTRFFTRRSFATFLSILDRMTQFCDSHREQHLQTYSPDVTRDVTDCLIRATEEVSEEEKEAVGLTDEHILSTVQELVGAGFDTIASTLQWALLFMITHPSVQEQVHSEIRDKVGLHRVVAPGDMTSLPLTEATLLEAERHCCIFPLALPHCTTRECTLQHVLVPARTLVLVNLWAVSRDPEAFPQPHLFLPQRFLDPQGQVDRAKTELFLPFGAGRRRCPGEQLARQELFVFFATLLQRCHFRPEDGVTPSLDSKFGLTLKPKDFKVRVTPRPGTSHPSHPQSQASSTHSRAGSAHPNAGSAQPDVSSAHLNASSAHSDDGSAHSSAGSAHFDAGSSQPDSGSAHINAGSAHADPSSPSPDHNPHHHSS